MYSGYIVDICVFTFSSNDILDGHNIIIYILPPMLKCPVRNNYMCPVRNAVFF